MNLVRSEEKPVRKENKEAAHNQKVGGASKSYNIIKIKKFRDPTHQSRADRLSITNMKMNLKTTIPKSEQLFVFVNVNNLERSLILISTSWSVEKVIEFLKESFTLKDEAMVRKPDGNALWPHATDNVIKYLSDQCEIFVEN